MEINKSEKGWLSDKRYDLERDLARLINKFNADTGLFITDISVPSYVTDGDTGHRKFYYSDKLRVTVRAV